jgi:hypothetical protein
VNDLVPVENVIVLNINSNEGVVVSEHGFFTIKAKVNDTLVFSSLAFKSKKVVLGEKEFSIPLWVVKLQVFTNELNEVTVSTNKDLNPISGGSRKIVDLKYFDDVKSSPKNSTMPPNGTIENGVNFVRMYQDVLRILRKDNPKKTDFYKDTSFSEIVMQRVSYSFFANTLQLNDDEIKLFLMYCENDSKSRSLMNPDEKFQLIDFLIAKNQEYKRITIFEK